MIQISNNSHKRQRGFTLMELLIVMSIMIILMLIAIPNFISMKGEANETSAMQSLRAIYQAQIQYQTNFPSQRLRLLAARTRRQHERRSAKPNRRRSSCREIWPRDKNRAIRSTSSTAPKSR